MPWNRKLCGTYHATHLNVNFIFNLIGISFWNYQMLSCHQVYFDQVYRVTFFWLRNKIVQMLSINKCKHFHDYFSHFWKRSRKFFPHSCVQPISARTQPPNYSADVCYLLLHQPRNSSMPVSSISRKNIKFTQNGFRIRWNKLGILKFSLQTYPLSMQNQVLVIFFAGTPLSHAEAVLKVKVTRNARKL